MTRRGKKKKRKGRGREKPGEHESGESLPGPVATPAGYLLSLLFVVLWLCPMFYQGWTSSTIRSLPPFLTNLQRASCLFTNRVPAWGSWYFQAKLKDDTDWVTLKEENYSTLEPFGYHTRLDLMLSKSGSPGVHQRQAMAEFIRTRYKEIHVESPPVDAIRFVKAVYPVGGALAEPEGRWVKEDIELVPERQLRIVSVHFFDGRPPWDAYNRRRASRKS